MDADLFNPQRYRAEIDGLIAAVEPCLERAGEDREARLQREAFRERCARARDLARQLECAAERERVLLSGHAGRLRDALELSRDFFSRRATSPA